MTSERKIRSFVSVDFKAESIQLYSTDLKSTIRMVKIHEILVDDFGYTDSLELDEGFIGQGLNLSVCDSGTPIKQMRDDYRFARITERETATTDEHESCARDLLKLVYHDIQLPPIK